MPDVHMVAIPGALYDAQYTGAPTERGADMAGAHIVRHIAATLPRYGSKSLTYSFAFIVPQMAGAPSAADKEEG